MVKATCCVLLLGILLGVKGESTFAGSSVTSDSSGTRSVLVTGRNGAGGVIQSRFGGGGSGVAVGSGSGSGGTYASTGGGPVGAFAGPAGVYAGPGGAYAGAGGAYASAGGAYAGAGRFGFPYWNGGGGSYASSSAGGSPGYYPYPYDPYAYGGGYNNGGDGVGVYSSSDSNGINTRFASVGRGGQATIVEQNGDEPPRVYNYRGANRDADEYDN
ncbi:unnamed protein product [Orchesella dallaii]|uniref:Uncharacterized protein n=1 Tax=Orchesella dallaii TaxID=48710 RepID=A0ABP1R778_9HEXA